MAAVSVPAPNAYSLADHALNSNDPDVQNTAFIMIEAGSIFKDIPFVVKPSFVVNGSRITGDLPSPSWVDVNGTPDIDKDPDPERYSEQLFVHRDSAEVDELELKEENRITDPFELKVKSKIMGFTYALNYIAINGSHVPTDPGYNPKAPVGMRARLDDTQKYGTNPACKIDAGGVDLSTSGTGDDGLEMEYLIQALLSELGSPEGDGIVIMANERWLRSFDRTIKRAGSGGGFRYDKDAFDRSVTMFKNARVQSVGRLAPTGTNRVQAPVISATETANGSADTGGTFTSIYAVKYGLDHYHGWHFGPLKPSEPYKMPGTAAYRVDLFGTVGLHQPDTRAIGRIYDIDLGSGPV